MSEPLSADELKNTWQRTLGTADLDPLDPSLTRRPAGEAAGTLHGLATVAETLGGGATVDGTLSGGSTAAGGGPVAGGPVAGGAVPGGGAGGFDMLGEIGRGGMGVVYRARQRALARDIALKFIRPEAAVGGARERFVSEALVNGLLDHPNIVPVHELGTTAGGEVYLAMKLVGGRSWKDLLHPRTGADRAAAAEYDLDRHLGVLQAVGNAVGFAHARGIVHRDLKPENVMVGEFGEVLVMDWGIAVDIRDAPDGDQRTQHKSTVTAPSGTPSYMAPELAEGRGADLGPWTDVYLLGAILHELLTGAPPHRGATLMQVLLSASRSAPPVYGAEVPAGLAAIATRAMARQPAARHPTVAAFQAALTQYVKHRESERIAAAARAQLAASEAMGGAAGGDGASRAKRYGGYAEAVAGFRQALVLWADNAAARDGEQAARLAYATAALAGGDLGLAEAQLEPLGAGGDGLRGQVSAARAAARARERAARRNKLLLAGSAVTIIAGLGIGFTLVNAARARALGAEQAAVGERDHAQRAEVEARGAARRAQVALAGTREEQAADLLRAGRIDAALALLARAVQDAPPDPADPGAPWAASAWSMWTAVDRGQPGLAGTIEAPLPAGAARPPAGSAAWDPTEDGMAEHAACAVAPDGSRLASLWRVPRPAAAGQERAPAAWVLALWRAGGSAPLLVPLADPELDGAVVTGLACPDADTVVAAFGNGVVVARGLADGAPRWSVSGAETTGLAVDRPGEVAVAHRAGWEVRDAPDGRLLRALPLPFGDGEGNDEEAWSLWSARGGWVAERADSDPSAMHANGWLPKDFARGGRCTTLRFHLLEGAAGDRDAGEVKPGDLAGAEGELLTRVAPTPDGRRLVAIAHAPLRRRLLLYDVGSAALLAVLDDDLPPGSGIAAVLGSGTVVTHDQGGRLRVYAMPADAPAERHPWPAAVAAGDRVLGFAGGPEAVRVLGADHALRTVRWRDGTVAAGPRLDLPAGAQVVPGCDGRLVAALLPDRRVALWRAADGAALPPTAVLDERERPQQDEEGAALPPPGAADLTVLADDDLSLALVYDHAGQPLAAQALRAGRTAPELADLPRTVRVNMVLRDAGPLPAGRWALLTTAGQRVAGVGGSHTETISDTTLVTAAGGLERLGSAAAWAVDQPGGDLVLLGDATSATLWDFAARKPLHQVPVRGTPLALDPLAGRVVSVEDGRLVLTDVPRAVVVGRFVPLPLAEDPGPAAARPAVPALAWLTAGAATLVQPTPAGVVVTSLGAERPAGGTPLRSLGGAVAALARGAGHDQARDVLGEALAAARAGLEEGSTVPPSAVRRDLLMALAAAGAGDAARRALRVAAAGVLADCERRMAAAAAGPPRPPEGAAEHGADGRGPWFRFAADGATWRYVAPGTVPAAPGQGEVRISVGFWIAARIAGVAEPLGERHGEVLCPAAAAGDFTAGGEARWRRRDAARLAAEHPPFRLPSHGELLLARQALGAALEAAPREWLADDRRRGPEAGLDPWGGFDRLTWSLIAGEAVARVPSERLPGARPALAGAPAPAGRDEEEAQEGGVRMVLPAW